MTRTLPRVAAAIALSAGAVLSTGAGGASAAAAKVPIVHVCPPQVSPCTVRLPTALPSLGVWGTVDKAGTSFALIPWTVTQRGIRVCFGYYRPADPAKLWMCRLPYLAPATFSTPGLPGPTTIVVRSLLPLADADPTTAAE